ncbi:MAG: hypothetical protein ACO39V_07355, partial [Arenicellales bacterium]
MSTIRTEVGAFGFVILVKNAPSSSSPASQRQSMGLESLFILTGPTIISGITPMKTAFASDARFLDHDTGVGHPERAARISHTLGFLDAQSWFSSLLKVSATVCEPDA